MGGDERKEISLAGIGNELTFLHHCQLPVASEPVAAVHFEEMLQRLERERPGIFFDTFDHAWAVEHSGIEQDVIFRSQSCFFLAIFLLAIMDTFGSFQTGAITNIEFLTIAALQFLFRSIASNCLHNQIYHSCVPRNCTRSYGNTDLFVFKEIDHSSDIPAGQDQVCVSGLSLHLGSSCQETLFWQRYW